MIRGLSQGYRLCLYGAAISRPKEAAKAGGERIGDRTLFCPEAKNKQSPPPITVNAPNGNPFQAVASPKDLGTAIETLNKRRGPS